MDISDRAQEILEKYWIENKENKKIWQMVVISDDPVPEELVKSGYARKKADILELTEKGWKEACGCVRRHRLAERLLTDVLAVKSNLIHELGCKFEHVLQKDVEENICTLLGHPTKCPHGKPIPSGDCCADSKRKPRKLVLPLTECEVKEKGKIAYLKTSGGNVLNKLTAMGVLPGLVVQLLRKKPAYLFKIGESQFAVDKALAEKIQVRLSK